MVRKNKPTNSDSPMEKIKGIDAGMLPPSEKIGTVQWHNLWKHAQLRDPDGWKG